ncbi:hypothetical protein C475_06580 [Halosimplex carlsbadense 2-9-1]|uniref:Uncharacterized protein n=1 Tax=Halosimplex carlsbadense 2-9-1 TaxID=797114 RepID=M0D0B2_9EURY|nr:hypothetical protein [Halosimplex carlsbadense]ELZ27564.1 hypothetical protein C475_06580 [Halosimplex carlsbadense 2-9-1]
MSSGSGSPAAPLGSAARWASERDQLPLSLRAVARFYARTGELDLTALRIKSWVDDTLDSFLDDAYGAIEAELESELGYDDIDFRYETKLTLPVELTLGYLYRRALDDCDGYNPVTDEPTRSRGRPVRSLVDGTDPARRERLRREASEQVAFVGRVERVARLCTEALLDGDMRDAINDAEYEDFETDPPLDGEERERAARIAQSRLRERVDAQMAGFPDAVREAYESAVAESNTHQDDDEHFRELMARALGEGDESGATPEDAVERIEAEYKYAEFEGTAGSLTAEEQAWPYCKTQYERVGVIYEGMIEMFRAADIAIEPSFEHAVVLAIIGAQVWLDDVDDFAADRAETQLTPVTAEYIVADDDPEAYDRVVEVSARYLDRAIEYAVDSDSILTGIAAEYIYLSGDPGVLPGSPGRDD